MVDVTELTALFTALLPFEAGDRWSLEPVETNDQPNTPYFQSYIEGTIQLSGYLVQREPETGEVSEIRGIGLNFANVEDLPIERWAAYFEGWKRAFPTILTEAVYLDGELLDAIHCASVLADASLITATDFERAIKNPQTLLAYSRVINPDQPPTEQEYQEYLATVRPESRADVRRRRAAAYKRAMAKFPAVARRIAKIYGLRLPRHVALAWAFFTSLSEAEEAALGFSFRYFTDGVFTFFGDGGLQRTEKKDFDPLLHQVAREDPAELLLLTIEGRKRYALFYDDPAFLPSGVVCSHRNGLEEWWAETYLDGFRKWVEELLEKESFAERKLGGCRFRFILEALDDFKERAERIRVQDRAGMRWSFAERQTMAEIGESVGIATELGDASGLALHPGRYEYQHPEAEYQAPIAGWIAAAKQRLQQGDPRYALALGRVLHSSSWDAEHVMWQNEARDLLVSAYRALGRDALARRVEAHHANRDVDQEYAYEGEI